MKKTIVIAVFVAVLGVSVWQVRLNTGKNGPDRKRHEKTAVAVEIVSVAKSTMRDRGAFTGSLSPRSLFDVAPRVAGRLEQLTVDIGDKVKSGDLIAVLDDDEYAQQAEQARAELAVGEANVAESKSAMDLAERELARVKALFEKRVASESEHDASEAQYAASKAKHNVALAEVARRRAALKAAEVRLSYTQIRVEWPDTQNTRVVGERYVDEGEMLTPNTPIVSVLDNSVLKALIDVIERDYPKIVLGQSTAIVTDAFPGRVFEGKIVRIAPLIRETSRQASVEIEVVNDANLLRPGMFVRAEIEFARRDNATVVPVSALARRNGKPGVFLAHVSDMKAEFVAVKPGITDGELTEILEPDMSGYVVTMGHHLLEDGASILLPNNAVDVKDPAGRGGDR